MTIAKITVAADEAWFHDRGLWEAVARAGTPVELVMLVAADNRATRRQPEPGFTEVRIRRHRNHLARDPGRAGDTPDFASARRYHVTPAWGEALERSAETSSVVVAAGPFTALALLRFTRSPLVVDALDIAADRAWSTADVARQALRAERRVCRAAALVRVCSARHAKRMIELHAVEPERVSVIPDGPTVGGITWTPPERRRAYISSLNLEVRPPVLTLAAARPRSAAADLALQRIQGRVRLLRAGGRAPELEGQELRAALGVASAGIVIDEGPGAAGDVVALARAGVPLLAEPCALEDAGLRPGQHASVTARDALGDALVRLIGADAAVLAARARAARAAVADRTNEAAATALLADRRFAELLDWNRPLRRRTRSRRLRIAG